MKEAEYQRLIRNGYKIIRKNTKPLRIEMKKHRCGHWTWIQKFTTEGELDTMFNEMLMNGKTINDI